MRIGVLALQGGFAEHVSHLRKAAAALGVSDVSKQSNHAEACFHFLPGKMLTHRVPPNRVCVCVCVFDLLAHLKAEVVEVRTSEELHCCDSLVIPGGESTCMAHICTTNDLLRHLREFCDEKPVWGTCAGMIFLAKSIQGGKKGGQLLIGNMDITVNRNFFGNQVHSFETSMQTPSTHFAEVDAKVGGGESFRAVFIRAPAIIMDGEPADGVEYLSVLRLDQAAQMGEGRTVSEVAVAAKQGNILVTAFHPELTSDIRRHALFVQIARDHCVAGNGKGEAKEKN